MRVGIEAELLQKIIGQRDELLEALKCAEQTVRNLAANLDGDLSEIARNEAINLRDAIAKAESE